MPIRNPHPVRRTLHATTLGLSVLLATGCQSLSGPNSFARVRVIDLSPDAPALDIYHGTTALAYNLSFGAVTSYVPVTPGSSTLTIDSAGSHQVLSSAEGAFLPGMNYTMLVNNSTASIQQQLLTDQSQPILSRGPSVRFIHQAGPIGAADVYLVPAGQRLASVAPITTNLPAGAATGYLAVPSCTCTVVVLPAGTVPAAATVPTLTGIQASYVNGSARTLILLDSQSSETDPQIITTIDADPSN